MKKKIFHILLLCIIAVNIYQNYDAIIDLFQEAKTVAAGKINDLENFLTTGYLIDDDDITLLKDSGITGNEYNFDIKYYPYYGMLEKDEKVLYKQIYANIKELSNTFTPVVKVSIDSVNTIIEAVYNDHPEFFWVNTQYSYKYKNDGTVVQINLEFNDTANNIEISKEKFEESANNIIKEANKLKTDYEKEKYVHDTILNLASYDLNTSMSQSAYSALVNGKTVCAGYSRAFQYIMIELGIPTYYVTGYSNGDHAWNMVLLSDGYYHVDLTWNNTKPISYQYFNSSDLDCTNSHIRTGLSVHLPECNGILYRNLHSINSTSTLEVIEKDIEEIPLI